MLSPGPYRALYGLLHERKKVTWPSSHLRLIYKHYFLINRLARMKVARPLILGRTR